MLYVEWEHQMPAITKSCTCCSHRKYFHHCSELCFQTYTFFWQSVYQCPQNVSSRSNLFFWRYARIRFETFKNDRIATQTL